MQPFRTTNSHICRAVVNRSLGSFTSGQITIDPVRRLKDGSTVKAFDALDRLAAMCSHGPDRGEQMIIWLEKKDSYDVRHR